jgi:hypothetical protein
MDSPSTNEAIYSLVGMGIGTILGGGIALINTYLTNRANVRLEKLKMHGGAKLDAYKTLFNFARIITNVYHPLSDTKISDFISIMNGRFEKEIRPNLLYYSPPISEILEKYDGMYFCATNRGDLSEESDKQLQEFIARGFFESAIKLKELIRKESSLL